MRLIHFLMSFFLFFSFLSAHGSLLLKNLENAKPGDFVVIQQGKSYTLFHIFEAKDKKLTIEEITIPGALASRQVASWRSWVENNAPQNTSWVHYQIDLLKGEVKNYYSFTKKGYFLVPEGDNFLATLLQLHLKAIEPDQRRKVGAQRGGGKDNRKVWQPTMVVEGEVQKGVLFNAYSADWPQDGGPLSGKTIEIYLPQDEGAYPAYFPYWLQTRGVIGQANVRVIDSGKELISPKRKL